MVTYHLGFALVQQSGRGEWGCCIEVIILGVVFAILGQEKVIVPLTNENLDQSQSLRTSVCPDHA